MLSDPRICVPPPFSDLSLFLSSLPLCGAFWESQVLAQLLWVTICHPQWKSEAFIQKVTTLNLWPWCLPPRGSPPFSVSMELNSQVEKWEQAKSIAIHRPPCSHSPHNTQKRERERKMNETHSSISRRWRRKPYWLKSKQRNREGKREGMPGKEMKGNKEVSVEQEGQALKIKNSEDESVRSQLSQKRVPIAFHSLQAKQHTWRRTSCGACGTVLP